MAGLGRGQQLKTSLAKQMAARSVPGHSVPEGTDPSTSVGVLEWIESFEDDAMVAGEYGTMLVAEGYSSLYSLEFTESELVAMTDKDGANVPAGRARRLVRAARVASLTPNAGMR